MAASAPATQLSRRRIWVIYIGLMLAMLVAILDQSIVTPALPTIVGDLHGLQEMQWVLTGYLLAATITVPIYGKLGDLLGRKGIFLFSIVVFLIGSALSGASQNMTQLIAFRALQGVGAGGLIIGAQAVLADIVSPRDRGKYMGPLVAMIGLSTVIGPLVGGFFTDDLSWRWCFYVNLPIGAIAVVVVSLGLTRTKRGTERPKLDVLGAFLIACASACVVFLVSWAGTKYDWGSWQILSLGAGFVVASVLFVVVEHYAAEPMIPLRLFRDRTFDLSVLIGLASGFAMFGALAFLPTFLQMVDNVSATESGLLLLPMVAGMLVSSIGSGLLISKLGHYKVFAVVGSGLATIGMVLLSRMDAHTGFLENSSFMVVFGLGLGLLQNVLTLAVQNAAAPRDLGTATASMNYFRQIGSSVGGAVIGSLFANRLVSRIVTDVPNLASLHIRGSLSGITPGLVHSLPAPVRDGFIHAYADALTPLFLYLAPTLAISFVLAWLLKEIPLRTSTYMQEGADGAEPAATITEPQAPPPPVVAVTDAHGSVGRSIVEQVAARLDVELVDLASEPGALTQAFQRSMARQGQARARLRSILPELLAAHHDLQDGAVSDGVRDRVLGLIASDGVVVAEDGAHRVLRQYAGALHVRLDGDRSTGRLPESNGDGGRYQLTLDPELLSPETCVELIVTAALAARPAPAASTASLDQTAAADVVSSVAFPREVERPASGPPVPGDLVAATAGNGHDLRVLADALQVELTRRQG